MKAIFKRELRYFFTSPVGSLVMLLFLLTVSLVLFVFDGQQNIFTRGIGDMYPFFELSSWVLVGLIPALTMRSFSLEKQLSTLEVLYTRPLSVTSIIMGKYFATLVYVLIMFLPTIFYVYTVDSVLYVGQNLDWAVIIGSYVSLLLMSSVCVAIGLWCSSVTEHQVVAFVLAVFIGFFMFYGIEKLSIIFSYVEIFSLKYHFDEISRGVIALSNVVYFIWVDFIFLFLTFVNIQYSRI